MGIYKIKTELLDIISELEENGGELTPELENRINIANDNLDNSIRNYSNAIIELRSDLICIENEQARLKELYEHKEKIINTLEKSIIDAITKFGDTKKSGVKYYDLGNRVISISSTKAVDVNTDNVTKLNNSLLELLKTDYIRENNGINQEIFVTDNAFRNAINLSQEEVDALQVEVTVKIPSKDIMRIDENDTPKGFSALIEAVKYNPNCKISSSISKSEIKKKLEEKPELYENIAKLQTNKHVKIV